eukprot:TRINITY_DN67988_c0_g1_i1.p1 TRINITY_DN67988_c0_g1~~TRINITY_DN67988_c0_g1_i1.p1  ORF type:complete len:143 (+),score=16.36 TRINITY_DN67988_c0_g1_i1:172-600(+)
MHWPALVSSFPEVFDTHVWKIEYTLLKLGLLFLLLVFTVSPPAVTQLLARRLPLPAVPLTLPLIPALMGAVLGLSEAVIAISTPSKDYATRFRAERNTYLSFLIAAVWIAVHFLSQMREAQRRCDEAERRYDEVVRRATRRD